jgi:hypothetical protein
MLVVCHLVTCTTQFAMQLRGAVFGAGAGAQTAAVEWLNCWVGSSKPSVFLMVSGMTRYNTSSRGGKRCDAFNGSSRGEA